MLDSERVINDEENPAASKIKERNLGSTRKHRG